jgi:glyoxylase-like metal-dependent hydrolase (beta-lactamase superfamily II)
MISASISSIPTRWQSLTCLAAADMPPCAVVDPLGDIEAYMRVAGETGMNTRFVVDTHLHADHFSAGRALASAAGANMSCTPGRSGLSNSEGGAVVRPDRPYTNGRRCQAHRTRGKCREWRTARYLRACKG